jgi:hypothetical protein
MPNVIYDVIPLRVSAFLDVNSGKWTHLFEAMESVNSNGVQNGRTKFGVALHIRYGRAVPLPTCKYIDKAYCK